MSGFLFDVNNLLNIYDKVMILKMFIDGSDDLKQKYIDAVKTHNDRITCDPNIVDAGFDLFAPGNEGINSDVDTLEFFGGGHANKSSVNKLDFNVCCAAQMMKSDGKCFNTGFYMYPRSSLSKTKLRLSNSVGIIDAGYRGHLIGMFDVVNLTPNSDIPKSTNKEPDYIGNKFDRYVQICAPGLVPILVEIVNSKEALGDKTERGIGGFGSTGR
jgi:dUTP pyrophosphatase